MADQVINKPNELNQKELGDHKLSRQEIQYLQSKEKLWAKDVSGGLFNDVIAVNKKSFETPKVKVLVDYLTTHFKSIPQFQKILKNLKWDKTSEFNKQCMALNMLLALSSSPADGETKKALLNSSNIASFSSNTIKALHAYQKKYEKTAGWSKADCIVGPKTIQQLIMDVGISTSDMISGVNLDSSYSSSKKEIQNSYQYALNSRKAIDAIMKDNTLGPVEKTKAMIEVYKKTSPDKKYSSATYMILHIKKLLAAIPSDFSDIKKQLLASFDKKLQLELKQYWNAANSKDDLGIKKTDDFFTEFENVEKSKMAWDRQFNLIMAVANGWKSYYLSNKKKAEKDLPELKQVDIALLSLQKYRNFDGIDHSKAIASLLKKIMIPSSENKNQKDAIDNIIKELEFGIAKLGNGIPPSDYYMREVAFVTTQMRSIDKGFDLTKGIFSVNNYESGDAIVDIISVSSETSPRKIKLKDSGEDARSYNADMAKLNDIFDNPANDKLDKIIQALDKTVKGSTTVGGTNRGGVTMVETRSYDAEAINDALKYVGLENIPEKSKKELWEKYNESKADIAKNARESADSTISSVILSLEEGRDFAQKQGNADLVLALNTQLINWEGFKSGRGSLYIDDKNALLKEMFTSLGITDTTNITRDVFVQKITALSMNMSLSYMIEKVLTVGVLEKHSTLIDNLAVGSASSKNLKLYSNIFGVGKARSDKTTNAVINVSKEVMVMVIVTVATMGALSAISAIGNGILMGARVAATSARIVEGASTLERVGIAASRYKIFAQTALKLAENANKIKTVGVIGKTAREAVKAGTAVKEYYSVGKAAFGAGKMIVEGSAFHFSSTAMSNALNGNAWDEGLHDWKGYARTALFLGTFKYVNGFLGKAFNLQTSKGISEALAKTISLSGKTWVISKSLLQGMGSVGIEFAAMQTVDIPLSLMFDGDLPDFSVESLAQTLGFIIGMRSYHGLLKVVGVASDAKGVSEVTIKRLVGGKRIITKITRAELKKMSDEAIKNKKENHNEFRGKVEAKQENVKTIREIEIEINKLGEEKGRIDKRLEELEKVKVRTDEVVTETNKLTKELKEVELKQKDLIEQKKQIESNPAMLKVDRIKTEILNYKEELQRNERVTEGEVLITDKISELEAQLLQVESTTQNMPSKFKMRATKLIDFVNRGRNVNTQEVEEVIKELDKAEVDVNAEANTEVKQSKLNWLGKAKNWLNEFRGKVEAKQENVKTSKEEIAKKQKKIEVLEQMLEADRAASDGTFETLQTLEAANKDIIKEKAELMEMEANMPTMPSKFKMRATKLIDFVNRGRNVNTQEVEEVIKELDKAEVDVNAEANTEVKQSKLNWLGKAKKWLNEFRGKVEAKQEAKSKNIDIKNNQQQKEVLEKSIETDFQSKILGKGIVIGGVTYRIELLQTTSQNKNHNPYKLAIYEKTSAGEKLVTTETFKENPVENGKINIKKGYKESFQSRLRDLENSYLAERVATEIGKVPAFKSSESVLLKIRDLFVLGKAKISEINDAIKDFNGVIAFLGKKMIGEVEMELEIIREGLTMKKNEIIKTQQSQKVKNLETVELSSNLALVQKAENLVELYESVDARIGNLNAQKKLLQNQIDETKKQEELNYKLTNLNQQKEFYASQIKQINETGRVVVENYVAGGITQERVVLEEDIINKLTLVEEKIESTRNDLDNLGTITNSKQDLENNIMKIDKQIESSNSSKEEIKQDLNKIPGWNEISPTLSTPSSNGGALMTYMTPRQKLEIFKTNSETGNNQMGSNKDVNANAEEANSNNASDETPSNEVKLNPATTGQIETISYGSAKEVG